MSPILAVATGGALGAVLRYLIQVAMTRPPGAFPYATLLVNLAGCLVIGVLAAYFTGRGQYLPAVWRLGLVVGLLGGFTTFSSYGAETVGLIETGRWPLAAAYVLASNVGGVALAGTGLWLGRVVWPNV